MTNSGKRFVCGAGRPAVSGKACAMIDPRHHQTHAKKREKRSRLGQGLLRCEVNGDRVEEAWRSNLGLRLAGPSLQLALASGL